MNAPYAGRYRPVAPLPMIGGVARELAVDNVADHRVAAARIAAGERAAAVGQALRGLPTHASLAPVLDVVQEADGVVVLIEAHADGPLLSGAVRMPRSSALLVAADIADALAALHAAGVAHGGLSTDAVALDPSGRPLVMGAGLAAAAALAAGRPLPTIVADLHALGGLVHLLVTGQPASRPPVAPASLEPDVSPALNGLVLALLSEDAHRPPPPAGLVAERLRQLAGVPLPEALAAPEPPRPAAPTAPRRGISDAALAAIAGGIALLAIILAVAATAGTDLAEEQETDTGIPTFTLPEPDTLTLTMTDEQLPLPDVLPTEPDTLYTDTTVYTDTFEVFTDEMTTATLPPATTDAGLTDDGAATDIVTITG